MIKLQENEVKSLKLLIARLMDSFEGYREASEGAYHPKHETVFINYSQQRKRYARKLQTILASNGINIKIDNSLLDTIERFFSNIKNILFKDDDELLKEVVHLEKRLINEYEQIIDLIKDNHGLRMELEGQLAEIESNLGQISFLEKAA